MKRYFASLLCGTAIALQGGVAFARSADSADSAPAAESSNGSDIIVTARKRDETLQSVPVAVTAIGSAQLQNNLVTDLTKIGELAPQVSIGEGGSGTGSIISIRGISSSSSDAGFDQSVLVNVDGVPFSRGSIIGTRLFDIQNVQVLAGPQALYFGKNSPAGVISINAAEPTRTLQGYMNVGYEFNADQLFGEGAVSGPLTNNLTARVAFRGSTQKGWMTNVAPIVPELLDPTVNTAGANSGTRQPASDELAGRVTLQWEPGDDFKANLKFTVNSVNMNTGNGNSEPYCLAPTTVPVTLAVHPLPGSDCQANEITSQGGVPAKYAVNFPYANGGVPYSNTLFYFGVVNMTKKMDNIELTSTTSYYNEHHQIMDTTDWSPYALVWAAALYDYRLFTQELRVTSKFDGPLNFMLGGYYEHSNRPFNNAPDILNGYNPVAQNYASVEMSSVTKENYISGFGELTWHIVPQLELSGGARWSHDSKNMDEVNDVVGPAYQATLYAAGQHFLVPYSDSHVSPEATLAWHPDSRSTLYGAYKTGYKSGGMSNPFLLNAGTLPDSVKFKPEVSSGFEVGYKGTIADGRLRFDVTAYTYKYSDLQVVSANNSSTLITFTVTNAAASRVKGIQGSFDWRLTDNLRLHGNAGYNDAKYSTYQNAQCYAGQTAATGCVGGVQDLSGKPLIRAPQLTYTIGADYEPELIPGWKTTISASGTHSSSFQTATDNSPGGLQNAYWLVDASVKVGPKNGAYELALIGRDLTNTYYKLQAFAWTVSLNPNQYTAFWNRPREVVLQGTVRF